MKRWVCLIRGHSFIAMGGGFFKCRRCGMLTLEGPPRVPSHTRNVSYGEPRKLPKTSGSAVRESDLSGPEGERKGRDSAAGSQERVK